MNETEQSTVEPAAWCRILLQVSLGAVVVHALVVLLAGLNQPLLDMHFFRQSQTALTSYWLNKGGPWLAYETPVVGAPWSIPYEFPLYQLLAAALAAVGVPLNAAGRLVGFSFFLAALWPLRIIFRALQLKAAFLPTAILFLSSPIYLYWSRTFMVESAALFFALLWLALLMSAVERMDWWTAAGATVAGCLAAVTKSTTFPAFALLGGIFVAARLLRKRRTGHDLPALLRLAGMATIVGTVPFIVGFFWVDYSDRIKMTNEFGQLLTSSGVSAFIFGTLPQRLSRALWLETMWLRALPDILGSLGVAGLLLAGVGLATRGTRTATAAAIAGFVVPFLVFTNLHVVHNYYQNANAIFLIAAAGLGIGLILRAGWRWLALVALLVVVSGQVHHFRQHFWPSITHNFNAHPLLRIALLAKANTQPIESLLVFGDDWSSTVPYHAERKALVVPGWTPAGLVERVLADPQRFLGEYPLGGIVVCTDKLSTYGAEAPAVQQLMKRHQVLGEAGDCRLLAP